jgi:hypothetical protein
MLTIILFLMLQSTGNLNDLPAVKPKSVLPKTTAQVTSPAGKQQTSLSNSSSDPILYETLIAKRDSQIVALMDSSSNVEREWEYYINHQKKFDSFVEGSTWLALAWFILIIAFITYMFIRFHWYGGLRRKRFLIIVDLINNDENIPPDQKAQHYPQNPYKSETFGLPNGTIRATLTLTLLFLNIALFYISVYAPPSSIFADRVEFMATAFLMMIAFYFGTKAVDVAKIRSKMPKRKEGGGTEIVSLLTPAPKAETPSQAQIKPEEKIEEKPATSYVQDVDHKNSVDVASKESDQNRKILSLTTYFETNKKIDDAFKIVAGNFDGQGISFGCLQWNFGQQTLQPIFLKYFESDDNSWRNDKNMVELYGVLKKPLAEQMNWILSIQKKKDKTWELFPDWIDTLKKLGTLTSNYQIEACEKRFEIAKDWCRDLGLISERAFSLMFDINVQNGTLYKKIPSRNIDVQAAIEKRITNAGAPGEEDKLVIIAEERSKASAPQWVPVVLSRKLTIARGQGKVYGAMVNLNDFGISIDTPFA